MVTEDAPVVRLHTPLLTADEVGELLRIPRGTVYDLSRRKHDPMPSLKVGRRKVFHREAVETWLAHCVAA